MTTIEQKIKDLHFALQAAKSDLHLVITQGNIPSYITAYRRIDSIRDELEKTMVLYELQHCKTK